MNKYIGIIGGIGTTCSFCPQIWKTYKTNSIDGLSLYMMFVHSTGISFWIIYGIMINNSIIIVFNTITFILLFFLIVKYIHIRFWNTTIMEISENEKVSC
jgi:MtN3 and saliva related transmembrane protein